MTAAGGTAVALLATMLLALTSCGETAASYCRGLYHEGSGGTPGWASKDNLFSEYKSCITWYEDQREQASP